MITRLEPQGTHRPAQIGTIRLGDAPQAATLAQALRRPREGVGVTRHPLDGACVQ